ncbi:hypothetical protein ALC53_02676 [Atta colombica]|uniref:Uncharacterized protein n=1 Tax=Atta colombica TaxID=520822 RepID=A0A195BSB8_9HYME|nr:hypothetical protein ALC53_02676 [Atta colombica]
MSELHRFSNVDFVRSSQQKQISTILRTEPQLADFTKTEAKAELLNLLVVIRADVKDFCRCNYIAAAVPARVDIPVTNRSSFPRHNRECYDGKDIASLRVVDHNVRLNSKYHSICGEFPRFGEEFRLDNYLLAAIELFLTPTQSFGPSSDFSRHTLVRPRVYHGRTKRQISSTKENVTTIALFSVSFLRLHTVFAICSGGLRCETRIGDGCNNFNANVAACSEYKTCDGRRAIR